MRAPCGGGSSDDTIARINLVRIAVGLVLLHRYASNAFALYLLPSTTEQVLWVALQLTSAVLLAIGLATPLAAMLLLLVQQGADRALLSWSLGSITLQMVLMPLALLPAGTRYSLDARFWARAPVRALYRLWGDPTPDRAATLRLLALLSYGFIGVSAAQFHWRDPLWRTGVSQAFIFTNPYFSPNAATFQSVIDRWPVVAMLTSRGITLLMLVWEAGMLPLALLTTVGRRFVMVHGLLFFAFSAALLNLAWLPWLEMVLWALIFWAGPPVTLGMLRSGGDRRLAAALGIYAVGLAGASVALPIVGSANPVAHISARIGAQNVDVFNYLDLRTNESYTTVARLGPDGQEVLLPFNAADGRRLAWHFSERTYYGISLPWRRQRIGKRGLCWSDELDQPWMEQVVDLDRAFGAQRSARYRVRFYAESPRSVGVEPPGLTPSRTAETCQVVYDATSKTLMAER